MKAGDQEYTEIAFELAYMAMKKFPALAQDWLDLPDGYVKGFGVWITKRQAKED